MGSTPFQIASRRSKPANAVAEYNVPGLEVAWVEHVLWVQMLEQAVLLRERLEARPPVSPEAVVEQDRQLVRRQQRAREVREPRTLFERHLGHVDEHEEVTDQP